MFRIEENSLDLNTYLALRSSVGWKKLTDEQALTALKNSLYTICVYIGDKPVGMGRMVGDGAVICYIQDLVVHPMYHGIGIGKMIMNKLINHAEELRLDNSELMLCLMCAKGREKFYDKFGFIARPTDKLGPGMIRYLRDSDNGYPR